MSDSAQLRSGYPHYDHDSEVFQQSWDVRAAGPLDGDLVGMITGRAADLFAGVMKLNGLDDYKWPPDHVDIQPYADGRGFVVTFATRASARKPIIFNQ